MAENQTISAGWTTLLDQTEYTAEKYFISAQSILRNSGLKFTSSDVVALSRVHAMDFHTTAMVIAAQKLEEAIKSTVVEPPWESDVSMEELLNA